jgi:hypothetical protein
MTKVCKHIFNTVLAHFKLYPTALPAKHNFLFAAKTYESGIYKSYEPFRFPPVIVPKAVANQGSEAFAIGPLFRGDAHARHDQERKARHRAAEKSLD